MLTKEQLTKAAAVAEECLNKVRSALFEIGKDHRYGIDDHGMYERLQLEARRLRGVFYSLESLSGEVNEKKVNEVLCNAYTELTKAVDRAKATDMDDPRWDEYMVEERCRSNIFHTIVAAKQGDYDKVLKEINRTFLN